MKFRLREHSRLLVRLGLASGLFAASLFAQSDDYKQFRVTSATFTNDSTLPLTTINNIASNGVNSCTANGAAGGDESPELSWTNAPEGTKSFVVIAYDTTASFTHWGMYNIAPVATGLPGNAGLANSSFGAQVVNDFGTGAEYGGPCPPANVPPDVHHYVFTVYALDVTLTVRGSANFPANAETLYQALIGAGREHHILASASITGLFSSTPSSN